MVVWAVVAALANPGFTYTYSGTRHGVGHAHVCLTRAVVRSGHVAVWLGVSNEQAWLQAGVVARGASPFLYVEDGRDGRPGRFEPVRIANCADVSLIQRGDVWRVRVGSYLSWPVRVTQGHRLLTGESYWAGERNSYAFTARTVRPH